MSVLTDIVGSVVLFLAATLASAAGIGGGGLNLPILIVIFKFGFSKAAVLSLWTVLGNILAQFSLNYNARHPEKMSRPLIYWDVIVVLLPAQLGGASIGVLLSDICPKTVLVILAMLILLYANAKTLKKGIEKWKKETIQLLEEKQTIETPLMTSKFDYPSTTLSPITNNRNNSTSLSTTGGEEEDVIDAIIQQELDERVSELIQHTPLEVPWVQIKALCVLWVLNASLLIGMNQYGECSYQRYLFLGATYPILLTFCIGGFKYVSNYQKEFPKTVLPSDLLWTNVAYFPPLATFFVGIICSLLGIGGGELMGPLMLAMGILPQVSSANTSVLSLFVTVSNLLLYSIRGQTYLNRAGWVFGLGFCGGFTGRRIALFIAAKFKRPSITVFALVAVLFFAFCLLIYDLAAEHPEFHFHGMC